MVLGVVLHRRFGGPLGRPVDGGAQQQVGQAFVQRRHARQCHALVREAHALRHAQAQHFCTGGGVQQARGQAEREQVVVGQAVVAGEGVLCENGGEVEVVRRGVVHRQQALVAVRRVGIEGARLQRLREGAAQILGLALEDQAAVQAEGGQHATGGARAVGQGAVELVVRRVHLHARGDEAPGREERAAELRHGVAALRVGLTGEQVVRVKACGVHLDAGVEAAPEAGGRVAPGELGQAIVGRDDGRRHVL